MCVPYCDTITELVNTLLPFFSTAFTPANPDDTLSIFRQPNNRESQDVGLGQPLDNRTALALGGNTETASTNGGNRLLRCVVAHTNDAGQPLGTVDWTINGRVLSDGDNGGRITVSPLVFGTRYGSDLMITAFEESDAGIYQCYATDDPSSDSDVSISSPFRLDTGTFAVYKYACKRQHCHLTLPSLQILLLEATAVC